MAERLVIEDLLDFANGKIKEWPRWERNESFSLMECVDSKKIYKSVPKSEIDFQDAFLKAMATMSENNFSYLPKVFLKVLRHLKISYNSDLPKVEEDNEFWRKFIVLFIFSCRYIMCREDAYDEEVVLYGRNHETSLKRAYDSVTKHFISVFGTIGFTIPGYLLPSFSINESSVEYLDKVKKIYTEELKNYGL